MRSKVRSAALAISVVVVGGLISLTSSQARAETPERFTCPGRSAFEPWRDAEADTALEGVQRFRRIAEDLRQASRGHIQMVAAAKLARGLLPEAFKAFRKKSTASTISIDVIARREARARIEGQQFDLALLASPFDSRPEA